MKQPTWSYSALNQFETCPAQYAAQRVYKTLKFQENEASIWGNEVHEAIETRLRTGKEMPERFKSYAVAAEAIEGLGGDHFYEEQMSLNRHFKPVAWMARDVWVRGILDVLIVDGQKAVAIDWKTGKVKPDPTQLKLFALLTFAHFPGVEVVATIFQWLKFGQNTVNVYYRADIDELWTALIERYQRLEEAHRLDIWTPRPSGLCKNYCGHEACEFHGIGQRR